MNGYQLKQMEYKIECGELVANELHKGNTNLKDINMKLERLGQMFFRYYYMATICQLVESDSDAKPLQFLFSQEWVVERYI